MRRFFLKLMRRRRLERELQAELAFHREMAAAGGNPTPFGNEETIKESARDLWQFTLIENLWRDTRYAVRSLRRSPALVLGTVLSLALGLGANATIFALAVEFLLSEPSVTDARTLVSVHVGGSSHQDPEIVEQIRQSGLFADVVGQNEENFVNWDDGSQVRPVFGVYVTGNYFTSMGIPVAYGRGILPSDPAEAVVLNHRFWRRHFNGDPGVVGRAITLQGRRHTVVGVLPEDHRTLLGFGFSPDIYLPRYLQETSLAMTARLKQGDHPDGVLAGLRTVTARLDAEFPRECPLSQHLEMEPLGGVKRLTRQKMVPVSMFFLMLLFAAGLVLLIACVNVSGLLLARASARRREIAVRLSLGAGRRRLLQQLMVESLLLSILGTLAGLALAHFTARLLAGIHVPLPIPVHLQIEPDWRVFAYAALLAVFATVACGLLPAWQATRESIADDLHRDNRMRLRRTLVTCQITVALVVLAAGSLFVRNLMQAKSISPGFDVRNTIRAMVQLPPERYTDAASNKLFIDRALQELRAVPGIRSVAAARVVPFTGQTTNGGEIVFPDGVKIQIRTNWNAVSPDYFRTLDIPILQGSTFPDSAQSDARLAIVNRTFVERYLAGRNAIGTTFHWGGDSPKLYRIIGVAKGTKNITIGEDPKPQLYESLSLIDNKRPNIDFVLNSALPPAGQLQAVRDALRRVEPAAGSEVSTLYSSIGLAFLPSQVGAALLGSVGLLGLLLAAIGLYGTMVYSVTRRSKEIGVRIAIGASGRDVSRMIIVEAARLLIVGSFFGLAIAFVITKPLAMFLVPGLSPADPMAFAVVVAVLGIAGLSATLGPVRRAKSIDPIVSLRQD